MLNLSSQCVLPIEGNMPWFSWQVLSKVNWHLYIYHFLCFMQQKLLEVKECLLLVFLGMFF